MSEEASSTGIEIHVLLPASGETETSPPSERTVPPLRPGVTFRGPSPKRASTGPSQLEAGSRLEVGVPANAKWDSLQRILKEAPYFAKRLVLCFLSPICTTLFLFRRPLACASELQPLLQVAQSCREEARSVFCAQGGQTDFSLPGPTQGALDSFQKSWEMYWEGKTAEWSSHSTVAGVLVGIIIVVIQIAEKNDPATRVFAFVAVAVLIGSFTVNQLLPRHLHKRRLEDLHYAFHFIERADAESSCIWNIQTVLSISTASTWWSVILSLITFACVFIHDTASTDSTDSTLSLTTWEMNTARAVMGTIFLISALCLYAMHKTLKSYGTAVNHAPFSSLGAQGSGSQIPSESQGRDYARGMKTK
ncbi:hypothetical protein C8R46DRAFT_583828 [Mycena filopes]|nr:hypothetical protein C8R46DRAFT_583828 [Mycena filopes]